MFEYLIKKINRYFASKAVSDPNAGIPEIEAMPISSSLEKNLKKLESVFGDNSDIIIRRFDIGRDRQPAAIICADGLVNYAMISESIVRPLLYDDFNRDADHPPKSMEDIKKDYIAANEVKDAETLGDVMYAVLSGDTVLLADRFRGGLIINTKGFSVRSIQDPQTETVIRGPREGFIENIRTNTSLIRRRIKDPALTIKNFIVGRKTRTNVSVLYMRNIAEPSLVDEVISRIQALDTDAILESGYIEQLIAEPGSPIFPTIGNTEKPDVAAGKLLEGRVAILVDGSPYALTMPMYFIESFQTSEDYYIAPVFASLLRGIRFVAFLISLFTLPIYVVLTTFHQELIPTSLLFSMAASAAGTPFPAVVEALIMILTFELLKESGVRLPRPAGQAVSMVGAIIIGETAISAGIISAPIAIAVAITAVATFAVPSQSNASSLLRILLIILSGILGGFGIIVGTLVLFIHLSSVRSFGVPYLTPFSPFRGRDIKDSLIRFPLWALLTRPQNISRRNPRRTAYKPISRTYYNKED